MEINELITIIIIIIYGAETSVGAFLHVLFERLNSSVYMQMTLLYRINMFLVYNIVH